MTRLEAQEDGQKGRAEINGARYELRIEDGFVHVRLPFDLDFALLSKNLREMKYHLAHDSETPDVQGWGPDPDPEGYYPYWAYVEDEANGGAVFAFPPKEYRSRWAEGGNPDHDPVVGQEALKELERWLEPLRRSASEQLPH